VTTTISRAFRIEVFLSTQLGPIPASRISPGLETSEVIVLDPVKNGIEGVPEAPLEIGGEEGALPTKWLRVSSNSPRVKP